MSIRDQDGGSPSPAAGKTLSRVLADARRNPLDKWPGDSDSARLDPECLPAATPRFRIEPGSEIFTLGSCFARSIEESLAGLGFRVAAIDMQARRPEAFAIHGREILNLYTPPAIWQHLAFSAALLDRGAEPTLEDISAALLETGPGRYRDLQANAFVRTGDGLDEILEARRMLHQLNRQAFSAQVVVITLGYVECWWDTLTGACIEFHGELARAPDPDRFVFRRIGYPEAYDYVSRTVELLRSRGDADILITTSPVPLHRTFTDEDVIVANGYSKAVLRAVAGAVAERFARVDYFPSYESVTMSRPDRVWEADRRHVAARFVARIMGKATDAYVGGDGGRAAARNALSDVTAHASAGEWELAEAALQSLDPSVWKDASPEDHLAAAELDIHQRRHAEAAGHIDEAQAQTAKVVFGASAFDLYLGASDLFRKLADVPAAGLARERAFTAIRHNRTALLDRLGNLLQSGQREAAAWLLTRIEAHYTDDAEMLGLAAAFGHENGLGEDGLRLALRAARLKPQSAEIAVSVAGVCADQGRQDEAIEVLLRLEMAGPAEPLVLRRLNKLLNDAGRSGECEALISRRLERNADDPVSLELLARARMRERRPEEALALALRAAELGNAAPGLPTLIERARGAAARTRTQA